jgi:hypothetical protein
MDIRFAPLDLPTLDGLKTEVLCLIAFSDERPPRGALGLVDWRLCGRVSSLIVRGAFRGVAGEALLMPPAEQRLSAERLLLLGAGDRAALDLERGRMLVTSLIARILALRVRTAAIALPHASAFALDAATSIDLLLEHAAICEPRLDELVLLDTPEARLAMLPRIERARRRALLESPA